MEIVRWARIVPARGAFAGDRNGIGKAIRGRGNFHQPAGRDARILWRANPAALRGDDPGRWGREAISFRIARIGAQDKSRPRSATGPNRGRLPKAFDFRSAHADATSVAGPAGNAV